MTECKDSREEDKTQAGSEQRRVVAVDMDDVLCEYARGFLAWHNETHGTVTALANLHSFQMAGVLGCSEAELATRIDAFARSATYAALEPVPGAADALAALRRDWDVVVVTARHPSTAPVTEAWLMRHLGHAPRVVYCGGGGDKGAVCQQEGAVALIDDGPHNLVRASQHVRLCLLLDAGDSRPWARLDTVRLHGEPRARFERCTSWPAALCALKGFADGEVAVPFQTPP